MKRLCRPSLFRAQMVLWVYAPDAETSSFFWCGWPHRTRLVLVRESGATYASMPITGVMPAAVACLWNSAAPYMLPWSVIATWLWPSRSTSLNSCFSRAAPSSIEYSVWTCRCAYGWSLKAGPPGS